MEVVSKPCQDQFLHPILVHYRKNKKIQAAKWGKPKKQKNKNKEQTKQGTLNRGSVADKRVPVFPVFYWPWYYEKNILSL